MNEKAGDRHVIEAAGLADTSTDVCRIASTLAERDKVIAALQAEVDALKAENARLAAPVKHPFGLMDCEMREADPCKCGAGWIPRGTAGILWYWQRHSREVCTLDLPDMQCWCGLKRSEHVDGHRILARATPPQDVENTPQS